MVRANDELKCRVLLFVTMNPGVDAKEISKVFDISGKQAVELIEELLNEGRLDFDEY